MTTISTRPLYVSRLVTTPVRGIGGEAVGRLIDLVVRLGDDPFPPVSGIVVQVAGRGHQFFIPVRDVASIGGEGVELATSRVDLRPFERRENELLLAKDVMDKQIVDVSGRRVVRVNDVQINQVATGWRLTAVDVSAAAVLSRLGVRRLFSQLQREVIAWDEVEFFASDVPVVKLRISHEKLARLHPADIARLLNELGYQQGSEVIGALDEEKAADAVEDLNPQLQAAVLSSLGNERAADILDEMEPDEVADVLQELPPEQAAALLEEMDEDSSEKVKRLLEYREETAGALMTTEYVTVPQDLSILQTLHELRLLGDEDLPDMFYSIYVLDRPETGRLVGEMTLRDLLIADPGARVSDVMKTDLVVGTIAESEEEVAEKVLHYNLIALPIVDDDFQLVGIVTVDDAMEVLLPQDWKRRVPRLFK